MKDISRSGLLIPILLVVLAAGYVIWHFATITPTVGEHVPAKVAPQVKGVPKVEITPAKINVYAPKAKEKLKLPDAIQANEQIHVVESTLVKADDHPHTITTVIDAKTGETTTLDRREPLPWLAFKRSGAMGLSYDPIRSLKTLYARQDLIQSKAIVLSASASLRSDSDKGVAVTLEYRW